LRSGQLAEFATYVDSQQVLVHKLTFQKLKHDVTMGQTIILSGPLFIQRSASIRRERWCKSFTNNYAIINAQYKISPTWPIPTSLKAKTKMQLAGQCGRIISPAELSHVAWPAAE